jgi:selenocysteine lyase/cysteine desulfurase
MTMRSDFAAGSHCAAADKDEPYIYLNNAATSWPKAPGVAAAVACALDALPGAANRGGIDDFDVFDAVRRSVAALMGTARHDRIAIGPNATWALNCAILGLGLGERDAVVTTRAEHNSVLRPLHALAAAHGAKVHHIDTDAFGRVPISAWEEALERHRPALCVFTHASNVTGATNDAAALAAAAKRAGSLVLIDLSQTLGWCDVSLDAWGVDLAAFTGHKYLLGPQGSGGLFVREGIRLSPLLSGGTGIHSQLDTMPEQMPLRLEAGTGNEPACHGLLAALDWARDAGGISEARAEAARLLDELALALGGLGACVIDPGPDRTPVLSFTLDGFAPDAVGGMLLDGYGIVARTGLHCAPRIFGCLGVDERLGTVRISLSRFTAQGDVAALANAMADIAALGADWI